MGESQRKEGAAVGECLVRRSSGAARVSGTILSGNPPTDLGCCLLLAERTDYNPVTDAVVAFLWRALSVLANGPI